MKKTFTYITIALALLCSCKTEKAVTIKQEEGFFSQTSLNVRKNTAYYGHLNKDNWRSESNLLTRDIFKYHLPQSEDEALKQYPKWQDFDNLCRTLHPQVHIITAQFLSKNLLLYYPLNEGAYSSARAETVKYHLDKLITNQYKDYWLLYDYLLWLKKHNNPYFAGAKNAILAYAQKTPPAGKNPPPVKEPDPKSAAFFKENPAAKAQLDQMASLGDQNETFIDRIRQL